MTFLRKILPLLALPWIGGAAHGQVANPLIPDEAGLYFKPDVAGTRQQPAFSAVGVRAGPLIAYPSLVVGTGLNNNVFNSDGDKRGDLYVEARPALRVASDWGRHQLALAADGALTRYADLKTQDSDQYTLSASGRLDADYQTAIRGRIAYARVTDAPRSFGETLDGGGARIHHDLDIGIGARADIGSLRLLATMAYGERRYDSVRRDDGSVLTQRFRDVRTYAGTIRVDRGFGPGMLLFVSGSANGVRSFDRITCCVRDAFGAVTMAGARFDFGGLVVAELSAGYRFRNYASATFRDYGRFAWQGTVDWYPTPLLSMRLSGGQDVANSARPDVAGIETMTIDLRTDYELLRALMITVRATHVRERYREIGATSQVTTARIGAEYAIGRHVTVAASGGVRGRTSSAVGGIGRYSGADALLTIKAAL